MFAGRFFFNNTTPYHAYQFVFDQPRGSSNILINSASLRSPGDVTMITIMPSAIASCIGVSSPLVLNASFIPAAYQYTLANTLPSTCTIVNIQVSTTSGTDVNITLNGNIANITSLASGQLSNNLFLLPGSNLLTVASLYELPYSFILSVAPTTLPVYPVIFDYFNGRTGNPSGSGPMTGATQWTSSNAETPPHIVFLYFPDGYSGLIRFPCTIIRSLVFK